MLKLLVRSEESNGTIGVRWCMDPPDLARLREMCVDMRTVFVLIVVAYEGEDRAEDRWLCPVDQGMEYLEMMRPGTHRLFARLVWSYGDNERKMRNVFLTRKNTTGYVAEVLVHDRAMMQKYFGMDGLSDHIYDFEPVNDVDIIAHPEGFAKPPGPLMKWWVNLFFRIPLIDQCHFRKRAILAFFPLAQPFIVLLWLAARSAVVLLWWLIALVLGARGLTFFRPMFRPWTYGLADVWPKIYPSKNWRGGRYSVFTSDKNCQEAEKRLLLHPVLLCMMGLTGYLLLKVIAAAFGVTMVQALAGLAVLCLLVAAVFLVLRLFFKPFSRALSAYKEKRKRRRAEFSARTGDERRRIKEEKAAAESQRLDVQFKTLTAMLSCPAVTKVTDPVRIEALPRRTVHLLFVNFKRQVCRPFAR